MTIAYSSKASEYFFFLHLKLNKLAGAVTAQDPLPIQSHSITFLFPACICSFLHITVGRMHFA